MAYSLMVTAGLRLLDENGVQIAEKVKGQLSRTLTGRDRIERTQVIGSSEETLDKGEIGTIGYMLARHTGTDSSGTAVADTISIRQTTGGANFPTLAAGDVALIPIHTTTTPYAIASSTGAPVLEYLMVEE